MPSPNGGRIDAAVLLGSGLGLFDELHLLQEVSSLLSSEPNKALQLLSVYDSKFPSGRLRENYEVLLIRLS